MKTMFTKTRKGGIDAGDIIGVFIVLLLGASLLPSALTTWYDAGAVNGTLEDVITANPSFGTMWNLIPLGVALMVFAGIVMVAVGKFKSA